MARIVKFNGKQWPHCLRVAEYEIDVLNRILRLAGEAVPPQIVAALIDRRWRQSHEKVYGSSRGKVDTTATATIAAQQA